ncbi:MAG: hypothetical protein GXP32_08070, partial [Kiritimatiellaeota bacterium]|nr:hypothetical protein [Kiritimatiellota bacterium]
MRTPTYEILMELGEYFLAGFHENRFDSYMRRFCKALLLYAKHADAVDYDETALFPSGGAQIWRLIPDSSAGFSYSYTFFYDSPKFLRKIETLQDERKKILMRGVDGEMTTIASIHIAPQYRCGGAGYTHSIINYARVLNDGLAGYRRRLEKKLDDPDANEEKADFHASLLLALDAVSILRDKHLAKLKSVKKTSRKLKRLIVAMEKVPENPVESFYEAMVATNFMWFVDDGDSIGRLDQFLYPYYEKDLDAGVISRDEAGELLKEFWRSFDCRSGWHMILGGSRADGSAAYQDLTLLCLETIKKCRRPNTGLRVRKDMPEEIWRAALDSMASGCGHPSLYNEEMYSEGIRNILKVDEKDASDFAYGGCTEIMFQGMSNVGSIDSGLNLLEVLENELPRLTEFDTYDEFRDHFMKKVAKVAELTVSQSNLNQKQMALYRPQPIRSLFVEDCIERGVDYNAGGARYNGSVINVIGFANTINSLFTIKKIFEGGIPISRQSLLDAVKADFTGFEKELQIIKNLDKHGCDNPEINDIASNLSNFVFDEILSRRCSRGDGFCVPGTIMFVTYAAEGADIGATPDGRLAFSPIADS